MAGPDRYFAPNFRDSSVIERSPVQENVTRSTGRKGSSVTYSQLRRYTIKPRRAGMLLIGPARVRHRGRDYRSDVQRILVRAGKVDPLADVPVGTPDPTAAGGTGAPGFVEPDASIDDDVFLHAVASTREVFVGQQVTVTWLLYARAEVTEFVPRSPRFDAFWSEQLFEPKRYLDYHAAKVGRRAYQVAVVAKHALFPTKEGRVTVPRMRASVRWLGSRLGRATPVRSQVIPLTVKPLPANPPPGFEPTYVGVYRASAKVDRKRLQANDSLTLELTIRGEGAVRRTRPPRLDLDGFDFRLPRDYDEKTDVTGESVRGERTYRYWTTPKRGGKQTIPPIELAYFDHRTGSYEITRTEPIEIEVVGTPDAPDADRTNRGAILSRDIRLIHGGTSVDHRTVARLYRWQWFWLLVLFPPLGFVVVVATDRVRRTLRKETPRARIRRARGRAKQRFKVAEIHLRGNRPAKFFGELAHVLTEHVEERVNQPVQSFTRPELAAFLDEQGFAPPTIKRITADLERYDMARFAPTAATAEQMRGEVRKLRELLADIERTQLVADEIADDEDGEEDGDD